MEQKTIPDSLQEILQLFATYSIWTWLLLIGVILVFYSLITRSDRPKHFLDIQLRKVPLPWILALGLIVMFLSQASLFISQRTPRLIPPEESFNRLQRNERVRYVIRLIPYDGKKEGEKLSVSKIATLGPPTKEWIFVGDYEELRNYTINQALYKMGIPVGGLQNPRATAIIFPLNGRMLYPANARGVLQVVKALDDVHERETGYKKYDFKTDDLSALQDLRIQSWAWGYWKNSFRHFRDLVADILDHGYAATNFLSEIRPDWNPLGFASVEGLDDPGMNAPSFKISLENGEEIRLKEYGARIFLMRNEGIDTIDNIMLCGFTDLNHDIIPDLGGKIGILPNIIPR
jgi:hypothetical protein